MAVEAVDGSAVYLTRDATVHVCEHVNCKQLARLACVSKTWHSAATEPSLWLKQLQREYHRAAANLSQPGAAQNVFRSLLGKPAAKQDAWLARFHHALTAIDRWRIVVQLNKDQQQQRDGLQDTRDVHTSPVVSQPPDALAAANADSDQAGSNSSGSSTTATAGIHRLQTLVEQSLALGLCFEAARVQTTEQSLWLHFPLPGLLDVVQNAWSNPSQLEVRVEACVHQGAAKQWVPIITSRPFCLPTSDHETLLQSHREGLYVWNAAEQEPEVQEEVPAVAAALQPCRTPLMDWQPADWPAFGAAMGLPSADSSLEDLLACKDAQGGVLLQLARELLQMEQHEQQHAAPEVAVDEDEERRLQEVRRKLYALMLQASNALWAYQSMIKRAQVAGWSLPGGPSLNQDSLWLGQLPLEVQRMLGLVKRRTMGTWQVAVYIHFEQLLQALPVQLPQALPLQGPPQLASWRELGRQLERVGPAVSPQGHGNNLFFWLHMDFHKLSSRGRLGSLVVPLYTATWEDDRVLFCSGRLDAGELCPPQVVVDSRLMQQLLGEDDSSGADELQGEDGSSSVDEVQEQQDEDEEPQEVEVALAAAADDTTSTQLDSSSAPTGGAPQRADGVAELQQKVLELVAEAQAFAAQLDLLLEQEAVMADFALYDAEGRLLMGRSGVELWTSEKTNPVPRNPLEATRLGAGLTRQAHGEDGELQAHSQPWMVVHRTVHRLHFLVDGADTGLSEQTIVLDPVMEAHVLAGAVRLSLPWAALGALFGLQDQQVGLGEHSGLAAAGGSSSSSSNRHAAECCGGSRAGSVPQGTAADAVKELAGSNSASWLWHWVPLAYD